MSKTETINALVESATTVFSQTGYDGASLRDIAAGAQTPLSTINMYFGTKGDLYVAVMAQLWREIELDRAALLTRITETKGEPVDLRDLIYALVQPVVTRARSATNADRRQPRLLRQWVSAPPEIRAELRRRNNSRDSLGRWIDRFGKVCPTLSKSEAVWAFSFIVGALYSWELMDNRYDEIIELDQVDADEIIVWLVEFSVSGVQGMIDRAAAGEVMKSPGLIRSA